MPRVLFVLTLAGDGDGDDARYVESEDMESFLSRVHIGLTSLVCALGGLRSTDFEPRAAGIRLVFCCLGLTSFDKLPLCGGALLLFIASGAFTNILLRW